MQIEQKQQLSSLMDGEFSDDRVIDAVSNDESLQSCWHRYHIVREAMRGELHSSTLTLDLSDQIAQAIANENLYTPLAEQPDQHEVSLPKPENLFWIRTKDLLGKVSQVALAACVTLAIIAGVQYHQGNSDDTNGIPLLNTVPMGVNVAPVGGIKQQNDQQLLDKRQYDKIRLLVQDYELQKRLNAQ
ncbi:RseA family anti-sigma factor [uncultured Gilliamella sp.]|uniref:RseA family anti-sigma factor n=1 Tax=uncultured Gilliamella sp. TaxID=1193505 RepID=UPI0025DF2CA9|nr:RseA family anti-sigma factor [uncultured Gilliamella sp.]